MVFHVRKSKCKRCTWFLHKQALAELKTTTMVVLMCTLQLRFHIVIKALFLYRENHIFRFIVDTQHIIYSILLNKKEHLKLSKFSANQVLKSQCKNRSSWKTSPSSQRLQRSFWGLDMLLHVDKWGSDMLVNVDKGLMNLLKAGPLVWIVLPTSQHEFIHCPRSVLGCWKPVTLNVQSQRLIR